MSSNNFTISTRSIYYFSHIAWMVVIFFLFIQILIAIKNPTDISIPILFSVNDAGIIGSPENHKISIELTGGSLKFDKAYQTPLSTIIAYHLGFLLRGSLFIFIFYQIKRILKNAVDQNTFNEENGQRLLRIGWSILFLGLLGVVSNIFSYYSLNLIDLDLAENIDCNNCDAPLSYNIGYTMGNMLFKPYLFMGLVTIALSTAFKTGSSMKEEVDLTI